MWNGTTVRSCDRELVAMQVDGVIGHGQVAHPNSHLVIEPDIQRINAGKNSTIPTPQVEVQHRHCFWGVTARVNVKGVQQETEVSVHLIDEGVLFFRVRDPQPHHAHRHLRHFIGMWVVHETAWTSCHKLVDKGLSRFDWFLCQA